MSEHPEDKQPEPAKDKGPEAAPEYAPSEDGSTIADGSHTAEAIGDEGPAGERVDG